MIKLTHNLNEIKIAFKYNNLNVLDLLNNIKDNINKINDFFLDIELETSKEKNTITEQIRYPQVDIVKIIEQKEDDNVKAISEAIKDIKKNMAENCYFLIFSHSFFEKYIKFFVKNKNIDNLIIIGDLIKTLKSNDKSYDDIKKIIHDSIIDFCLDNKNKISNMEILNFVKKDDYYSPYSKFVEDKNSVKIFGLLNINEMDAKFLNEWKAVGWPIIFDTQFQRFAEKIISLVNDMSKFNLLFELLITNNLKKEQGEKLLISLQDHYMNLYESFYEKEEEIGEDGMRQFIEDSANLVYYSDKNGKIFDLTGKLKYFLIKDIYMKVLTKYKDISIEAERKIVTGLLKGNEMKSESCCESDRAMESEDKKKNDKVKSYLLIYLFERCPNSKNIIIKELDQYKLKEEEIFAKYESESIKLVHGLLSNDFYELEELENYAKSNQIILDKIIDKIDKNEIIYNQIKDFFVDKKSELAFKKRLLIIYLMEDDTPNIQFNLITKQFKKVKEKINELKLVIDDQNFFFKKSKKINTEEIENLIKTIENNYLNFCDNNKIIDSYSEYIKKAKERSVKRKSLIFMEIYERESNEEDEMKHLEKTESKINKYISSLTDKNAHDVDKELSSIVSSLTLDEEKINQETNTLMEIFNLKEQKDKKIIINSLICLYYRDKIINLLTSIKLIIETAGVKKEALFNLILTIINYLGKNDIINTIQVSIKILKNYSIDIFNENNKFNKILMRLSGHPNEIQYLFALTVEECKKAKVKLNDQKLINNLEQIETFVKIIENKNEISKMRDKELIKKINDELNSSEETISDLINYNEIFGNIDNLIKITN